LDRSGFTGEERGKVDGKGRMSIPARFREVLQRGDAKWQEGLPCTLQMIYGDHLEDHLEAVTLQAHAELVARFQSWEPVTSEEQEEKELDEHLLITQSQPIEVDKDGRIVMPARFRERLGLSEGEVVFAGKSDRFEIWSASTYETKVAEPMRRRLAARGAGYSPRTSLARARLGS
jgi:MraZ protein